MLCITIFFEILNVTFSILLFKCPAHKGICECVDSARTIIVM